jgi:hypothetical protein
MTSHCDHGTPLTEDCGKCWEMVERMKEARTAAAFPIVHSNGVDSWTQQPGLSKREWFAGLAMQALVSTGDWENPQYVAVGAIKFADELLKELAK